MSTVLSQQAGDVTARLNDLKVQIERGKTEKARAEANAETFGKQREELLKQLAELGVAPEGLNDEIARLDREVEEALTKAETLLKG